MNSRLALAIALSGLLACGGERTGKTTQDAAPVAAGTSAEASSAAPAMGGGAMGMFGSMLAAQADKPGPYDEPRESPGFQDGEPHTVVLELDGSIVELQSFQLLGGGAGGVELRALLDKLRELGSSDKVKGLVLRFNKPEMSFPVAEELRAALISYRTSLPEGRTVHCHAESVANIAYFLMSACDSIALAPSGDLLISGVAAVPIHVKGALDRLGVQADFLHVGAFKGAAEPLTRDRPSPEMVETLGAILDETYAALVNGIAAGRQLEPDRVRQLIDTAMFTAEEAVAARLVDKIDLFARWRDEVLAGGAWKRIKLDGDGRPGMSKLMEMLGVAPRPRPTGPHLALVYAVGTVVDGEGGGSFAARREIAPRTLGAALEALGRDDSVKAIVIRVDSGGGSALASEILWQTIAEVKKRKPVVVSMGEVAASGGYYLGCGANTIFASRTTLTGSVGVVGGKLAIDRGLGRVGVTAHPIGRGKRALLFSTLAPWSRDERAAVQRMMEGIYQTFVGRVAESRGKQPGEIHQVAQGRVWTGAAALERGLIDRLGGLEDAIAEASTLGGLNDDAAIELYPPEPTLLDILGSIGAVSLPLGLDAAILEVGRLLGPREAATVLHLFRQLATFQHTRVQTALILPVLFR
jgi:protease-4